MPTLIYKLCSAADWTAASAIGSYTGSSDDQRDGFIHFSTGPQLRETARRYFKGVPDLALIAFDADGLGPHLRWERSRGGELFPHLYGPLPTATALWVRLLALDGDGIPVLPEGVA